MVKGGKRLTILRRTERRRGKAERFRNVAASLTGDVPTGLPTFAGHVSQDSPW